MSAATLAASGSIALATGVAFAIVARAVAMRGATGDRLLARHAHTAWWGSLGAYLLIQGGLTLAASAGALMLDAYLASRVVTVPLICLSAASITFYLLFLYTGRTTMAVPLCILYGLVAVGFIFATFALPQELFVRSWVVSLDDTGPLYRLLYVFVGVPPIAASAAYLWLLRRARTREQRYRILLVAGSILTYVGSGLAARLSENDVLIFTTLVLFGSAAAALSLAAYYPPRAIRRWLDAPQQAASEGLGAAVSTSQRL